MSNDPKTTTEYLLTISAAHPQGVAARSLEKVPEAYSPKFHSQVPSALTIPELLSNIFLLLETGTLPKVALVSKHWHAISLPQIWRDLKPTVLPLLELFCPMIYSNDGWVGLLPHTLRALSTQLTYVIFQDFDPNASTADWEKFCSRASLVRTLVHDDGSKKNGETSLISRRAVSELSFSASAGERPFLLPKLRTLTWVAENDQTLLQLLAFVSNTVEEVQISLRGSSMHPSAPRVLFLLGDRLSAPKMACLGVETFYDEDDGIQLALGHYLKGLPTLTRIVLTGLFASPDLVQQLRLTNNLRELGINLSADNPKSFLESLTMFCPLITLLEISLSRTRHRIPWTELRSLLSLHELSDLRFRYNRAIVLSSKDIAEMGVAWPQMKTLALGGCAIAEDPGVGTPLSCLTDFAVSFPILERLVIDFSYDQALPSAEALGTNFQHLKVLGVGTSSPPEAQIAALAEFILGLCPLDIRLACYTAEEQDVFGTEEWLDDPEWKSLRQVKDLMDFAKRMRWKWDGSSGSAGGPK